MTGLLDHHSKLLTFPGELYLDPASETRWPRIRLERLSTVRAFGFLSSATAHHILRYTTNGYDRYSYAAPGIHRTPFKLSLGVQYSLFERQLTIAGQFSRRDVLDAFFSSLFTALRTPATHFGEKNFIVAHAKRLNWVSEASRFFADYPDGFMISNVRQPADWYASARQHNRSVYGEWRTAERLWKKSTHSTILAKQMWPNRVIVVPFERLVKAPEQTMARIAHHLGIEFEPVLTMPSFSGVPIDSNSSFHPRFGLDQETLHRGRVFSLLR